MRNIKIYAIVLGLFVGFSSLSVCADEKPGWQEISAPEVKEMIDSHDESSLLVIHVLSEIEYDMQHITGSINIPVTAIKTSDRLPQDMDVPIILYCMGLRCPYTATAADALVKRGYTQVYGFLGGIPEWRRFNYALTVNDKTRKIRVRKLSPTKVVRLLKEEDPYILDVRPANFARDNNFIEGANLCPLVYLSKRYPSLPTDRPILLTDWAMNQAVVASKFLTAKGYNVIGVLKGGIERWRAEKRPVIARGQILESDLLALPEE